MRLIGKLPSPELGNRLSAYLTRQGIANTCDSGELWIHNEDQIEQAEAIYKDFLNNPADPQFAELFQAPARPTRRRWETLNAITILICAIIFIWGMAEAVTKKRPIIYTPVYTALLYDYPKALELRAKLVSTYTVEQIENPQNLPGEGQKLYREVEATPLFNGFYGEVVDRIKHHKQGPMAPLFEKIRQGQVWRLFTPALLHANLLHIFFNVIWLLVLGNQVEKRIGWLRYLVFMLVVGIVSNTAQYLMGGPLFLGISGVVTGLLGFIWMRQRIAPWEGYLLNRITIVFLTAFIFGMAALQIIFFILEVTGSLNVPGGIANTAHITGVLTGALFGRLKLWSAQ